MKEYLAFPHTVKNEVRKEQHNQCAICGTVCHLSIHHKIPSSLAQEYGLTPEQTISKENAVGVCRTPCHDWLDYKAITEHKFYPEVLTEMKPGEWYILPKRGKKK